MAYRRFPLILLLLLLLAAPLAAPAERSPRVVTATGTGFLVNSEGYILTNEHVIHGATKITVTINGQDYKAEVVKDDPNKDIALLKVEGHGFPAVRLGDSDGVQINDQVVAIGCPDGRCGTVTQGRIANLDQTATFEDKTLHNLLMIDVTTTHGSSGGPLLNTKGEVIGITMGGIEGTGFGFAIPTNQAIPHLQRIPRFSVSQMGQATENLSFQEIIGRVTSATVYVKAKIEKELKDLLPQQVLGIELGISDLPAFQMSLDRVVSLWPWLHACSEIAIVEGSTLIGGRKLSIVITLSDYCSFDPTGMSSGIPRPRLSCPLVSSPPEPDADCRVKSQPFSPEWESPVIFSSYLESPFLGPAPGCYYVCDVQRDITQGKQDLNGISITYSVFFRKRWGKMVSAFESGDKGVKLSQEDLLYEQLRGMLYWSLHGLHFDISLRWDLKSSEVTEEKAKDILEWLFETAQTILTTALLQNH